ncbi:MAG: hypothetical protein IJB17_00025 [Oscillospiraceae bacterium]|nr:hypothetical protein [Oscillospiraceae bacterium]
MDRGFMEDVYASLQGLLVSPIPGVEDLFTEGSDCARWYKEMRDAYARLRDRLGVIDEDADIEIMIQALQDITDTLCYKMYAYGAMFSNR